MFNILQKINSNLIIAIPLAMVLGFFFGLSWDSLFLKDLIPIFTFIMVYPMMVTLQYREVFKKCAYRTQGLTQILNLLVIPLIGFTLSRIFFDNNPYMALGLLLVAIIPSSGMAISWTSYANGNVEVAVKMMIIGLALGAILSPFYIQFFLGAEVDVNVIQVLKKIMQIVFIPMVAGFLTRQTLLRWYGPAEFKIRIRPVFPPLATLGVLGIVFTAMALRSKMIVSDPVILVKILIPLLLFYMLVFVIGVLSGKKLLPREDAVAMYYGTILRNLSIALAIAVNAFGPAGSNAALVIVVAFIIQTQVAVWSVRFIDRIMGPQPSSV